MMKSMNKVWLGIGAAIVLLILLAVGNYNGLVGNREDVRTSLANIESQYQRRADLIPNLVATVEGAADFEQETLTAVVEARAKATSATIDPSNVTPEELAEFQQAQGELSTALGRLLAISENYPTLTATQGFRDLQVQLEGTENRIAVARQDYNGVARTYNTKVQRFPTVVTASLFGFDEFSYFESSPGAETAPTVEFN